jgi:L-threonate 2-dehydrogenase
MFTNRVPHMLAGDYTPHSALDIFVKDLGIVLESGQALRFPLPLAAVAQQMFLMGAAAGLGREDDAAVVKVYETLAGIRVAQRPPET